MVYEIAGLIGSALSLIGVVVALVQIRRTRRAAEAAKEASGATQELIVRNLLLIDISNAISALEEVKALIRARRSEAALLRVSDLIARLIQAGGSDGWHDGSLRKSVAQMLTDLSILRDLLERHVQGEEGAVLNPVLVNGTLSKISDRLNRWMGTEKYQITPEGSR